MCCIYNRPVDACLTQAYDGMIICNLMNPDKLKNAKQSVGGGGGGVRVVSLHIAISLYLTY